MISLSKYYLYLFENIQTHIHVCNVDLKWDRSARLSAAATTFYSLINPRRKPGVEPRPRISHLVLCRVRREDLVDVVAEILAAVVAHVDNGVVVRVVRDHQVRGSFVLVDSRSHSNKHPDVTWTGGGKRGGLEWRFGWHLKHTASSQREHLHFYSTFV